MELLTYVGQATKRKPRFEEMADDMVFEFNSIEKVEGEMAKRNHALATRLEKGRMRFDEFQRASADGTIVSALSGVMLGDETRTKLKDQTFAASMRALPYLWQFHESIKSSLNSGRLTYGGSDEGELEGLAFSPSKGARKAIYSNDELVQDVLDEMPTRLMVPTEGKSTPATWNGVEERLSRYLVTPVYSWYSYGEMERMSRTGMKQMRRRAYLDKKCCEDCIGYDSLGWQPIGSLPVPGERCRCHDRCRCSMEYR
jgi:hypothetical protein